MILKFIFFTLVSQVVSYLIAEKSHLKYSKILILGLFLCGHLYFFPSYFLNKFAPATDDGRCGMPIIGIFGAFWVVGGVLTLVTHYLYWIYSKAAKENRGK